FSRDWSSDVCSSDLIVTKMSLLHTEHAEHSTLNAQRIYCRSGISAAMPTNGGLLARSRLPSPVQRSERQAFSVLTYSGYPGWPLSTHPPPVYPPPAPASPAGHTTAHSPWLPGSYSPPSVCTPHHPPPEPYRPADWHPPGQTHTTHP